ncbi:hypothetical protein AOLI_G00120590 [Acnodon oligacanthus]
MSALGFPVYGGGLGHKANRLTAALNAPGHLLRVMLSEVLGSKLATCEPSGAEGSICPRLPGVWAVLLRSAERALGPCGAAAGASQLQASSTHCFTMTLLPAGQAHFLTDRETHTHLQNVPRAHVCINTKMKESKSDGDG